MRIGSVNPFLLIKQKRDDIDIQAQLKALGLESNGSKEKDLAAIREAKLKQTENNKEVEKQQKPQRPDGPPKEEPPWIDLMEKLGLTPTGTKEGDFLAISQKINEIEATAKTEDEKSQVASLKSEFQSIINSDTNPQMPPSNEFTGME